MTKSSLYVYFGPVAVLVCRRFDYTPLELLVLLCSIIMQQYALRCTIHRDSSAAVPMPPDQYHRCGREDVGGNRHPVCSNQTSAVNDRVTLPYIRVLTSGSEVKEPSNAIGRNTHGDKAHSLLTVGRANPQQHL